MRKGWRRRQQDRLTKDVDSAAFTLRVMRWLAARWSRHEFDVGSILLDYARRLSEAGRDYEALAALDEAIDIGSRHVRAKPVRYAPNLAAALLRKAHLLAGMGHLDEALSSAAGAVDIYRSLAPGDRTRFEPVLFAALTSVGCWHHGRREFVAALPRFEEAAELARRLPADRSADRAMAMNNVGATLVEVGRQEDAVAPLEEAVTLRRGLAHSDRDRYEGDLVASLRNLEHTLSALGRYVEAVAVADELSTLVHRPNATADGDPG